MAEPMARSGGGGEGPRREDAFVEGILRFWDWVQANARAVVVGLVLLVAALLVGLYYINYRQSVEEQAAADFQRLRLEASQDPQAAAELPSFIRRYEGTDAAEEARLVLARVQLAGGDPQAVLETLDPLAGRAPDAPVGYAARLLRVRAYESLGDVEPALAELSTLGERARYPFQRRSARADRARLLAEAGRLEEAERIYADLARASENPNEAALYEIRLGEVRGRLASRRVDSDATAGDEPQSSPPAAEPEAEGPSAGSGR